MNWISVNDMWPDAGDVRYAMNDSLVFIAMYMPDTTWQFISGINVFQVAMIRGFPMPGQKIKVTHWVQIPTVPK